MPSVENVPSSTTHPHTLLERVVRRVRRRVPEADPALQDIAVIEASGRFDKRWYVQHYPDVASSGMDPIQHYVRHGAAEGRDPNDGFSTTYYLSNNPDVAASGINPFRHYIEHGISEGRTGSPDTGRATERQGGESWQADCDSIADSILFDARFYLKNNPDVAASGMAPLIHFCKYGARELRHPSEAFDIGWYWLTQLKGDDSTNPLEHYLRSGLRAGLQIRAVGALSETDRRQMVEAATQMLESRQAYPAQTYVRLGIALTQLNCWPQAAEAFSSGLALDWGNAKLHARLAGIFSRQRKWWQAVESWSAATNLDSTRASWFFHLGEAREKMNRFALAAEAYQSAIEREPEHPSWYYLLGYTHEKAGHRESAAAAYAEAVARDPRKDVKAFGVGVFHQARGYWPEAAEAYARELEGRPASAELHFKLGMARDRCYRWQEAEAAYRGAIALKPDTPYWHYRYGFVLERQRRFVEAAEAYAAAATLSPKHVAYWWYRCGYALAAAGEHEAACKAYLRVRVRQTLPGGSSDASESDQPAGRDRAWLNEYLVKFPSEKLLCQALARDFTDARTHYRLGRVRERRGDWSGAAAAYTDAVMRSSSHQSMWHYRLGFVLFRVGRLEEACDAFRETYSFGFPHGVDTAGYFKNPAVRRNMLYREHIDVLPVRPRTILYESTHGASVGGNPYAIFVYLLGQAAYKDWTHVWAVNLDTAIPHHIRSLRNVILVEYDSDLYARYLATASHLINDSTFPYWFSRRPGQKYLNTWHGTPLKTLGKSLRSDEEFLTYHNIQRNFLHATHLISPNRHTTKVLMDDFDVRAMFPGKLAETGYPRVDRTLNASPEHIAAVCDRLKLDPSRPIALYAPTWRGTFGQSEVDLERLRADLEKLAALPCQWIFRGHPFSEQQLRDVDLPVTIAPADIDTADVLAITDVLVTDYSSIFFDFMSKRCPIFYYCYDLEEYGRARGMYFDIRDLPGTVCEDIDALVHSISLQLVGSDAGNPGYRHALETFCPHDDGHATDRAVGFFFEDDDSYQLSLSRGDEKALLFFGGYFAPNGITASFLNLMHVLHDSEAYRIVVAVEPGRIKKEPTWLERFRELPTGLTILGRPGRMVASPEQQWVADKYRARREFPAPDMCEVLERSYRDEYRRCFGYARFDSAIDFDGYTGFWTTLFALAPESVRKACWLHSDCIDEFTAKYPNLRSQFEMYPKFDALVSVTAEMERVNRDKVSEQFPVARDKFCHCINPLDDSEIKKRAAEPVDADLEPWMRDTTTFVSLGRLSPEKDHAKLIEAFSRIAKRYPEARLLILGDGPLRVLLEQQIKTSQLQDVVCLAGFRPNPFPLLGRCDCVVLPSNYEGAGMALLEAMVLGRAVVATNIGGHRGVLQEGCGLLVENSAAGLAQGMLQFLQGELEFRQFDAAAYRARALDEFQAVVGSIQKPKPDREAHAS